MTLPRPTDDELHDEYWALRQDGHGIVGAQHVLVEKYADLEFGRELDSITHPRGA